MCFMLLDIINNNLLNEGFAGFWLPPLSTKYKIGFSTSLPFLNYYNPVPVLRAVCFASFQVSSFCSLCNKRNTFQIETEDDAQTDVYIIFGEIETHLCNQ